MVKGESGLLAVHTRKERPVLKGTLLHWANGAEAHVMSASDPDRFGGRNGLPPGATRLPNGPTRKRHGTCCNLGFVWGIGPASWRRRRLYQPSC